jgi:hypothetical protein
MNARKNRRKTYQSLHACMEDLLGREDLRRINQLGLWHLFTTVEQVKHFASQPRAARRGFFDRYEQSLGDESRTGPADADHRLFDLPQSAGAAAIKQRYRELALAFHPDREDGDHQLMQEINAAYQRLLRVAGGAGSSAPLESPSDAPS